MGGGSASVTWSAACAGTSCIRWLLNGVRHAPPSTLPLDSLFSSQATVSKASTDRFLNTACQVRGKNQMKAYSACGAASAAHTSQLDSSRLSICGQRHGGLRSGSAAAAGRGVRSAVAVAIAVAGIGALQ